MPCLTTTEKSKVTTKLWFSRLPTSIQETEWVYFHFWYTHAYLLTYLPTY